jgi:adenosylcobyric acid synthase
MTAKGAAIMVCGTSSGAGKSLLTTALARFYARRGLKVAPFKAQNMSNNARVVEDGEMASAQYLQALAARCIPHVQMNPVLLKPESETHSQVILLGRRDDALASMEWRHRSEHLWPTIRSCLTSLLSSNDLVIIEGAGSPAEINLQATDIVNMRVAVEAQAATLLICDVDRGGAFAHLYGTYQLLPAEQRALIRGFVLNKFRGNVELLSPGPEMLRSLTGVPVVGVLPMWREHGLPEEDGVFDTRPSGSGFSIAVVAYPGISNLDEFAPLRSLHGVSVSWARHVDTIAGADLLILPGSKHVAQDLGWLRRTGLDVAIAEHVRADKPTLAVCGGLQLLGHELLDPEGVEGAAEGLRILPLVTEFQRDKRYRRHTQVFAELQGFWKPLSGLSFDGYEIRHGRTRTVDAVDARLQPALPADCAWQMGPVLALYTHGLFENSGVLRALFGAAAPNLEDIFEALATFAEQHIGVDTLLGLLPADSVRAMI